MSRILVIDVERRSLESARRLLEGAGYDVGTARTGAEALTMLRDTLPGLVVLEPMLPGQDGFRLCQGLKRGEFGPTPLVIIASRIYRGPRYRNMAREAGADGYFERPQQDAQLLATVQRIFPPVAAPAPLPAPAPAHAPEDEYLSAGDEDLAQLVVAEVEPPLEEVDAADGLPLLVPPTIHPAAAPPPVAATPRYAAPPHSAAVAPPIGAPPPVAPAHSALRSAYLPSDDEIENALANVLGPDTPSSGLSVPLISPSAHDRAEALAATIEAQALAVLDLTWPRAEHDALSVDSPEEPALVFERPRRAAHGAVVATGASPDPDFIVARPENDAADEFAISFEPVAAAPVPPPFESGGGSAADDAITGPDLPESLGHALDQIELPRTSRTLEDAAGYESMALPRVLAGEGTAVPFEFDMVPAQSEQKEWAPRSEEERHTDHALEEAASTGSSGADLPSIPPSLLDAFPTSPTDVGIAMEPEWKRLFPAAADGRPARAGVASAVVEPPPARPVVPPPAAAMAPAPDPTDSLETLDADLERAFAGLARGGDPTRTGAQRLAGPAEDVEADVAREVPTGLRGMDAGTAELLSSLEELEQDIPEDGAGFLSESGWTGSGALPDAQREIEPSVPHAPPPPEDHGLDELIARAEATPEPLPPPPDWNPPSSELEVEPLAGSPIPPSGPLTGTELSPTGRRIVRDVPREPAAPPVNKKRSSFASWLLGSLSSLILIAGIGAGIRHVVGDAWQSPLRPAAPVYDDETYIAPAPPRATRRPGQRGDTRAGQPVVAARRPVPDNVKPPPVVPEPTRPRPRAAANASNTARRARPAEAAEGGEAAPGPAPAAAVESVPVLPPTGTAAESDAPTEAPAPGELPIVRTSELDVPIRLLNGDEPDFRPPPSPDGTVRRVYLNVLVGPDGTVQEAKVLADPGEGMGAAAREAVLRWTYTEPRRGTAPVRVWKAEVVEFP